MRARLSWVVAFLRRWWLTLLIVALVVWGVIGLISAVGSQLALAAVLVAALLALAKFNEIAGRVLGATIVGALVLMGVNVIVDNVVDRVGLPRPRIELGLVIAVGVMFTASGWYLRGSKEDTKLHVRSAELKFSRGSRWGAWTTSMAAAALAIFLIIDFPIIVERGKHSLAAIAVGLGAATALVGIGAWCRLRNEPLPRWLAGVSLPVVGLVLLGLAPIVVQQTKERTRAIHPEVQVPSRVDVRIVTDGSAHPDPPDVPADPALAGFDVRYSVGYAEDDEVRWTLAGTANRAEAMHVASQGRVAAAATGPPVRREDADGVLVLLVDGTAPAMDGGAADLPNGHASRHELGRWRRVAQAARTPRMPMFALLQAAGPAGRARLKRWRGFTRNGDALSLQQLGRRAVTDNGLALAIGAPTAEADLALAVEHRPILLFDDEEPVPVPLSVEWLFSAGHVTLCRDRGVAQTKCDPEATGRSQDLVTSTDPKHSDDHHLEIEFPGSDVLRGIAKVVRPPAREAQTSGAGTPPESVPTPAPAVPPAVDQDAPQTAIYVHAVPVERPRQSLLYLDYWWYLPDNPVTVGLKAFCGAGLVIPGITCHDHRSDWEGMTVVVDRTTTPRVLSVQYAEHDDVVAIPWTVLRSRWDRTPMLREYVDAAENGEQRPLAFIAKGTHSSYPLPCSGGCSQLAHKGRGDDPHGGELYWIGDFSNVCGTSSCVHRLPTFAGGQQPALWNAFAGRWGKQECVLTYYCDTAESPPAPGRQKRYLHPTRCTGRVDRKWAFKPEPCDQ